MSAPVSEASAHGTASEMLRAPPHFARRAEPPRATMAGVGSADRRARHGAHPAALALAVTLVGGMACRSSLTAGDREGAPRPTLVVPAIPFGHRLGRVAVARASLAQALAGWPRRREQPDCLIVFAERGQWLLGCEELFAHDGYLPTGERLADQLVRWAPRSLSFAGTFRPYVTVQASLVGVTLGVSDNRTGTERPVVVMHDWEDLHRFNPPFRDQPLELWFASFVHESFHAYQAGQPRMARAPTRRNRKLAGPSDLAAFYLDNDDFRADVAAEHQLLRSSSLEVGHDGAAARRALAAWRDRFRARQSRFAVALEAALPGQQALVVERFLLFQEGSARYVEARFLSDPPAAALAIRDEPDFHGFTATRGRPAAELAGLGALGKNYFYSLGMYLCLLLDVAEPDWKTRLFTDDDFLIAAVERAVAPRPGR
jgi:hypothetical protein